MNVSTRIYLDNAATSWPKPEAVCDAADHYLRQLGAPSGRSGYREALESNRIIERTRTQVARLMGAPEPSQVVFTASGTDSLNMAIRGIVRPGDHVVTTVCDHNSVLRPLRALGEWDDVSVSYVPCDELGRISAEDVRQALRPETRLVAIVHASNVTGALQPVEQIGSVVHQHSKALLLVDAAQSLGYVPIDVVQMQIDLLAAPGHKGLLGPLGTGVLYIRSGVEKQLRPLRLGGTGTQSDEDRQPESMPEKYEPGNHNLPGLAGLTEGLQWIQERGVEQIQSHHSRLTQQLLDGLNQIPGVFVHGPKSTENRTSVVSFTLDGYDPQDVSAVLEASYGIQCRAGLHCAPRMHAALGTLEDGGTVRMSLGWTTTTEEIETAVAAVAAIAIVSVA